MLSALTQPNFPRAAIGIEHDTISALALRRAGRNNFEISRAAAADLPINLVTPSFFERNISNPSEFAVVLEEAVVAAGLAKNRRWSVALPSSSARSAILTLDRDQAAGHLDEILDWKAENSFGVSAGELRITRYKIAPSDDGRERWFATAVKLSVIDEYETIFERLGWKAGLILPKAIGETRWLISPARVPPDALLISEQNDGFTAVLLRNNEPAVVRTVTCEVAEIDDEIYRLLMFYRDRFGSDGSRIERLLLLGKNMPGIPITEISNEALGHPLATIDAANLGLAASAAGLPLDAIAAPAGLASYAFN